MSLSITHPPSYPPHQTLPPSPSPSPFPSSSPSPSPITAAEAAYFSHQSSPPPPKSPVNFSPPLIAMVAVVATAFLIVSYSRIISRQAFRIHHRLSRWRRRGHSHSYLPSSSADLNSPPSFIDSPFNQSEAFHVYSPYGLDDAVIKTIPLSLYTAAKPYQQKSPKDCAVCLLEFEDNEYVRTLPVCSHAFHVDCIDMWLRSHANCPLCRAGILRHGSDSPFVPLMAARIRPSFDEDISILNDIILEEPMEIDEVANSRSEITAADTTEITEENVPTAALEDRFSTGRDFVLKRSYSFGFERSLASERMVMEPTTASPWRYRRSSGSFWSKRPSPFGSLSKSRVFSFRYYRGMKSPFFRRRGFFPLSESRVSRFHGVGGGSSRRSKSMTSPMFGGRLSSMAAFSSSRLRCGDPEALLSPERFNSNRR